MGPFHGYFGYCHALDPRQRRFYSLMGRQIWPPRAILDFNREWTVQSEDDMWATIAHMVRLLKQCAKAKEH